MIDDEKIFTDEQIGLDPNLSIKIGKRNPFFSSINFIKKHKLIFIISVAVFAVIAAIFFLMPRYNIVNTTSRAEDLGYTIKTDEN